LLLNIGDGGDSVTKPFPRDGGSKYSSIIYCSRHKSQNHKYNTSYVIKTYNCSEATECLRSNREGFRVKQPLCCIIWSIYDDAK